MAPASIAAATRRHIDTYIASTLLFATRCEARRAREFTEDARYWRTASGPDRALGRADLRHAIAGLRAARAYLTNCNEFLARLLDEYAADCAAEARETRRQRAAREGRIAA